MKEAIEVFEEKSAIYEFCGGKSRIHAESLALREIAPKFGSAAAKAVYAHMHEKRASK